MRALNRYSDAWFSTFLHTVPEERTEREVEFLDRILPPRALVLDLPCGSGRHARRLAARGHRVVAIDREARLLAAAAAPGDGVRWVCADMGALPIRSAALDAVLCLWQSFGQHTHDGNAALLRAWADVVRPGGILLLDLYHRRFFERTPGERSFEMAGRTVRERRSVRAGRLTVELDYDGSPGDRFDWQLFAPEELASLARRCGWVLEAAFADFDPVRPASEDRPRAQYLLRRV